MTEPGGPAPVLVLGCGSDLRGDDAAGLRVAEAVAARGLPGVDALVAHQLAPEHAAELVGRRLVLFVDASVGVEAVTVEALDPRPAGRASAHHLHPAGLLALASALGWSPQQAAVVHVPAVALGVGDGLSATTAAAVHEAAQRVAALADAAAGAAR